MPRGSRQSPPANDLRRWLRVRPSLLAIVFSLTTSCATVANVADSNGRHTGVELTPCNFTKLKPPVLCAKLWVYENRAAQSGRVIGLNIVVLPARTDAAQRDAVFYLAGGPGQAAALIASAGEDSIMQALRQERDLVFVDMRGTGDSNGLQCNFRRDRSQVQSFLAEIFDPSIVRACRLQLETVADLKYYNTRLGVEDLEDVRIALGYGQINLYGISYGSRAALEYLRRYPASVRSAALAGAATAASQMPLQFAKGAELAMARLLHDCAVDEACNSAFPNLAQHFSQLLQSFSKGSIDIQVTHPSTKTLQSATLSRGSFVTRLLVMLYNHRSARLLPLIIERASQGDWTPYVQSLMNTTPPPEYRVFFGSYLSATCSESLALIDDSAIARATAGTFLGDYRTRRHQQACGQWPRGDIDDASLTAVQANHPVLLLSGDIDPATPAQFATESLQALPNGRQVILRNTAHDYSSACARQLIVNFIITGSASGLDTSCADRLRRPPFATELPARYNR